LPRPGAVAIRQSVWGGARPRGGHRRLDRIAELVALGELILLDAVDRGTASRSRLERPYAEA